MFTFLCGFVLILLARIERSHSNYILDHLKNCQIFFHSSCPMSSAVFEGSEFLHILTNSSCHWLFDPSHSHACEVVFHCGFVIFLMTNYIKCFFQVIFSIVFLFSISLISTLIFPISFLLLTSGLVWSFFLVSYGGRLGYWFEIPSFLI